MTPSDLNFKDSNDKREKGKLAANSKHKTELAAAHQASSTNTGAAVLVTDARESVLQCFTLVLEHHACTHEVCYTLELCLYLSCAFRFPKLNLHKHYLIWPSP